MITAKQRNDRYENEINELAERLLMFNQTVTDLTVADVEEAALARYLSEEHHIDINDHFGYAGDTLDDHFQALMIMQCESEAERGLAMLALFQRKLAESQIEQIRDDVTNELKLYDRDGSGAHADAQRKALELEDAA